MVRGRHAQRLRPIVSTGTWPTRGDQVAIIWESDDPAQSETITYRQLHERVCKFANVLKAHGVNRGDRVTIYLPMIPEAAYAMLACARIGAIHSVVFAGFSPESLASRIEDAQSKFIVTADEGATRRQVGSSQEEYLMRRWRRSPRATKRSWSCVARVVPFRGRLTAISGCTMRWPRSAPTVRRSR